MRILSDLDEAKMELAAGQEWLAKKNLKSNST